MKYLKLWENFNTKFELTETQSMDGQNAQDMINTHYHDKLLYRGNDFFNNIYMDKIIEFASNQLEIGKYIDHEEFYIDSDTGEEYNEIEKVRIDGQESYLGYLPNEDVFVSGWDMFGDDENIVYIKFDDDLTPYKINGKVSGYGIFYSKKMGSSVYERLHEVYPSLLDIRLD